MFLPEFDDNGRLGHEDLPPSVWTGVGLGLVLIYVVALAFLKPVS